MAKRPPWRDRFRRAENCVSIQPIVLVQFAYCSGLPDVLNAKRSGSMPRDRAQPRKGSWVSIQDGHQSAVRRHPGHQLFHVTTHIGGASLPLSSSCSPTCIEAIGRCDCKQPDIASVLAQ